MRFVIIIEDCLDDYRDMPGGVNMGTPYRGMNPKYCTENKKYGIIQKRKI